jgi:transcription initiation factor TFIIIB Brf1 subunit/transcription initiation factor TFIIB
MDNLKPCKYCGSDNVREIYTDEGDAFIVCENCGLGTRRFSRLHDENLNAARIRLREYWNA